jgi:hypothetical protein
MEQTAPTKEKTAKRSADQQLVPPDERFWQRYSPHAELPLSGAGSFALHALVLGVMVLLGVYGALWFGHANRSLPVEAVRLDLGGGGGSRHGQGDEDGKGEARVEAGNKTEETAPNPVTNQPAERPDLKVKPADRTPIKFDDDSKRYIRQTETQAARAFEKLANASTRFRVDDKPRSYGKGGTGSGGGSGDGKGKGTGDGRGDGSSGKLTQREKRMLRWSMLFNTRNAPDYLSQLQGLGAILAVPVRENGANREYRIIRNLAARPAKLLQEDVSQIQRIYWVDDNPQSVMDVMNVLRVPVRPSHFVAFMPEALENKLFQLEKKYLDAHHPGRTEDDIVETKFRINHSGNGYEPEVIDQKVK